MSALAVLLIAVGAGDVCRRLIHARWVAPVVAVVAIVACTLLGALWQAARFHGAAVDRRAGPRGSAGHGVGIDDMTEYFLVGSFASWILALGGLALVAPSL